MKVRDVLRGSKDSALALAGRALLNARLRGIGEVRDLSLNTKRQAFRVRLQLLEEAEPIDIHVRKYVIRRRGNHALLTVVNATASRRWVAAALRRFVVGHRFVIPTKAETILKLLA